jgi:hypothetical protein
MRILNKLFGGRSESPVNTMTAPVMDTMTLERPMVAPELFIDTEAPTSAPASVTPSRLKQLADQDRMEEGRQAGYEFHDMDICRSMEERLKAEISRAIDEDMDRLKVSIGTLIMEMRRMQDEAMLPMLRMFEARKDELERHLMKLQEQHLLVAGNSGYAELPVSSFSAGFKQGYTSYLESTLLMSKYQG